MSRLLLVDLLLPLAACAPEQAHRFPDLDGGVPRDASVQLDDLPSYTCPPPPDDAIIYYASASEGLHSFADPEVAYFYVGYFYFASILREELDAFTFLVNVVELPMTEELAAGLVLYSPESNPLDWQGVTNRDEAVEDRRVSSYDLSVEIVWNGQWMWRDGSTSDVFNEDQNASALCLSHVRPDRLAGTLWFAPNVEESPDWPAPVWFAFNDATVPLDVLVAHRNADYTNHSYGTRVSSDLYSGYIEITEDEVWPDLSEDAR